MPWACDYMPALHERTSGPWRVGTSLDVKRMNTRRIDTLRVSSGQTKTSGAIRFNQTE